MTTVARHVGFCPICEGDFKLLDETKLVHHGYKRPGVGYIIGDCLSVHKRPYELSDETCQLYKLGCQNALASEESFLERLQTGKVTSFMVERAKPLIGLYREYEMVEVATPNGYEFARELDDKISTSKYRIKSLKSEIARMDKWIDAWVLKPVRTFDEILEVKKAAVAERKAKNDARKAVKQAKADALKAKYAKWEQEKAELMAKWKGVFLALGAEMVEAEGRDPKVASKIQAKAWEHAYKMRKESNKKGYLNFWARDLGIDDVMISLGLAEVKDSHNEPWVQHRF